ncbi:hypothetical protein [Streptococcus lactarius]|uniref:hypothetical protein n=1 Tax=Streptococcus lactarius TaxID=684066 RepID=UPI00360BD8A8
MLEEEYAMAASFLQKQELDVECEWRALNHCIELYDLEAREASQACLRQIEAEEESLWQSYQRETPIGRKNRARNRSIIEKGRKYGRSVG